MCIQFSKLMELYTWCPCIALYIYVSWKWNRQCNVMKKIKFKKYSSNLYCKKWGKGRNVFSAPKHSLKQKACTHYATEVRMPNTVLSSQRTSLILSIFTTNELLLGVYIIRRQHHGLILCWAATPGDTANWFSEEECSFNLTIVAITFF